MTTLPAPGEARSDPLLSALLFVARHHGRAVSARAVLAGLPIVDNRLSPSLFLRAAERANLVAEPYQRPISEIPGLVLPAIIILRDGRALVLMRNDVAESDVGIVDPGIENAVPTAMARSALDAVYSGYVFFLRPGASGPARDADTPKPDDHWFWGVLRDFRTHYAYIALAAFLINLLSLAFPLFVMNVYDRVLPNGAVASLVALSLGVILAFAFEIAMRMVRSRMIDLTGKQIDITLAARLFSHVLGLRMEHKPRSAGMLANQIRDFESVREFCTSGTVIAATDLVFAFIFLGFMFAIVGPLAVVPLVLLPISLAIGFLIQRPLDAAVQDMQVEAAARHGILVESIGALETIRVLGAEGRVQTHWERSVAASTRAGEALHRWSALSLTLSGAAQNIASLLIVIWGVFMVLSSHITIGALIAATMLSGRILGPVTNIASVMMRGTRTLHALRAIDKLMQLPVERPRDRVFIARSIREGALRFENVTFRYPEAAADALSDVSFAIRPGERVGIVGRIGSGKTTVGRLATALYTPQSGMVLVDGVDIRQYDPADLRAGIGFVTQECELFRGTLRENVVMGRPEASDEELIAAARVAGLEAFVARAPQGYDMPVAEGGRSLSGGQRQAVALARALIRRPRILFLDEPTSALDLRSEAEFAERLAQLGPDMTLIISTHRVSLLQMVDRLIVFDQGRIVADGARDGVLAALQGKGRGLAKSSTEKRA